MTASGEPFATQQEILKPFARDPDGVDRRRTRRTILIIVSIFCFLYGFAFALFAPMLLLPLISPIPVLFLVVIWALPESRTAPIRSLSTLTFVFVAGLVLWPNYIAVAPPGLPWITMARITGFPLVLSLLLCTSISADFRSQVATAVSANPIVWKLLLAFVVLQTLSIGFSRHPFQSFDKLIVAQVSWTAMFFIAAYVFMTPGRIEKMAKLLWSMAMVVGVIGVFEWRKAGILWIGHIPHILQIPDPAVQYALATHVRSGDGTYRTQSTFSTSLGFGEYLALTFPFILHFLFGKYKPFTKTVAFLSIPPMMLFIYITGSRLAVVGALMSYILYYTIWAVLRWRSNRQSLVAPAMLLALPGGAGILGALILFWPRLHNAVIGSGAAQYSTDARKAQVALAIPKAISHPWGYGMGMSADTVGFTNPSGFLTLDSYYLTVLIEYGIIGFIVYFGLLAASIFYAARFSSISQRMNSEYSYLIPLAIAMSNFFVIKSVFSQQDNHPIIFMFLGMIAALCSRIDSDRRSAELGTHAISTAAPPATPSRRSTRG